MRESAFQSKIVRWLKSQGCFVMAITVNPGVPTGTPDVVFFKEGFYGFIEVKPDRKARFQPLQKETVAKLDAWSWAKIVYPDNWEEFQKELAVLLKD